jgi:hypothetical protein
MGKQPISIEKLMEGRNPYKVLLEETRGLAKKWEPTGLLDGLKSDPEVLGMAVLLENQSRQLIDESTKTGGDNAEQWAGVALPLVRRIFGEIAAKEFVSVQPMNLPSGLVFYLDFRYGRGNTQAGQPQFSTSSLFGGSGHSNADYFGRTDTATGGLYGAGRFGYSINDQKTVYTSAVTRSLATWRDVDFNPDWSASVAAGTVNNIQILLPANADINGARAFTLASSSGTNLNSLSSATSVAKIGTGYYVTFAVDDASQAYTASLTMSYHIQPAANARGDFEDGSFQGSYTQLDIPEIDLQMKSEAIVAKTRKLKAVWTPELAQDLNAFHSVDAEAELTSMLSEYVSMEIDLEILDMLIQNALTEDFWSVRIGYEWNGSSFFTDSSTNAAAAYNKQTWFQTLGTKIQKVSNRIHQKTMRGGANFMVCSPDVATILESIPGFTVDTSGDKMQFAMGVSKVGSFANRFQVYKNPYMLENVILLGFRGTSFLETGAVYAPYIPLITTPLVYDPNNLTPRKGVMTRYAKKVVRPEFYGRIIVADLQTL